MGGGGMLPKMKPLKVRLALSGLTLEESMAKVVVVESHAGLIAHLREQFWSWKPTEQNVTIEPYGYDDRNGWNTHLVCVDGKAALFADGPAPWA